MNYQNEVDFSDDAVSDGIARYLLAKDAERGWPMTIEIREAVHTEIAAWLDRNSQEIIEAIAAAARDGAVGGGEVEGKK